MAPDIHSDLLETFNSLFEMLVSDKIEYRGVVYEVTFNSLFEMRAKSRARLMFSSVSPFQFSI